MSMITRDEKWDEYYVFAKGLVENKTSFENIEKQLNQKGANSLLTAEIVSLLKKTQHAVNTKHGLQKIGLGLIFLISGFLITCVNFHANESFTIVMYSFTTIGISLVFWGVYNILG
jgi:hypothetical protein